MTNHDLQWHIKVLEENLGRKYSDSPGGNILTDIYSRTSGIKEK